MFVSCAGPTLQPPSGGSGGQDGPSGLMQQIHQANAPPSVPLPPPAPSLVPLGSWLASRLPLPLAPLSLRPEPSPPTVLSQALAPDSSPSIACDASQPGGRRRPGAPHSEKLQPLRGAGSCPVDGRLGKGQSGLGGIWFAGSCRPTQAQRERAPWRGTWRGHSHHSSGAPGRPGPHLPQESRCPGRARPSCPGRGSSCTAEPRVPLRPPPGGRGIAGREVGGAR